MALKLGGGSKGEGGGREREREKVCGRGWREWGDRDREETGCGDTEELDFAFDCSDEMQRKATTMKG